MTGGATTPDAAADLNGETEPAGALGIDRCFCFQARFADLHGVAAATGAQSVAELQQHVTFGRKCRLCHPYVRRMLRTGETVFDDVVTADDEPDADAGQAGSPSTPRQAGVASGRGRDPSTSSG